jgi:hypothetical protein
MRIDYLLFHYRWKDWSARKFVQHWGNFLKRPDANRDPQFTTIEKMYQTATKTASAQQSVNQQSGQQKSMKTKQKVKK